MARRSLPKPYDSEIDANYINNLVNELEELTGFNFVKGERIEINGVDSSELTLISPNGTRYKLGVSDAGVLEAVSI